MTQQPPEATAPAIFIAKESAVLRLTDGDKVVLRKDRTRVAAGHPMLDQYPDYFREVDPTSDVHYRAPEVEFRNDPPPKSKAAKKAAATPPQD